MDEQQLQQQIVQLVQAAMQGDQQATQQIQQIMQAAQQGDQQAAQIAQMIQQVAQQMQLQQVQAARFGAKLNYIKQLKGQCPEGYKMEYYKEGGQLCKKCMKVHQDGGEVKQTPNTVAGQFKMASAKCGKKMKKKEEGGAVETEKCGGKPKLKKKAGGGPMKQKISKKFGGGVQEAPTGLGAIGAAGAAAVAKAIPRKKIVWSAEDPTTGIDPDGVVVHRPLEAVGALRRRLNMQQFVNDIYTLELNLYNQLRQAVQAAQLKADDFKNKVFNFIK